MEALEMNRVFVMYKLKKGVTIEDYKKWSREVDQKITPFQKGVKSFEPYEIKKSMKKEIPFDVVEDVVVESWEAWEEVQKSKAMERVNKDWVNLADEESVIMIYGEKIESE
jgi:hypothetical protein